MEDQMCLL